ncbi:MAG: DNA alkylation repair protein [Anaerovoracaceae bacterium]
MDIFETLYSHRNEEQAVPMANYMKNLFPFLGLKKPERESLIKEFLKAKKKEDGIDWDFIFKCFDMPEREFQYMAINYILSFEANWTKNNPPVQTYQCTAGFKIMHIVIVK